MRLRGCAVVALLVMMHVGAPRAAAAEPPAAWIGDAAAVVGATTAQPGGIELTVGPGRMVLEGPVSAGSASGQFIVHVAAPFPVRVTATLADAAVGRDGTPVRAALGTTDWTLRDVATLNGNAFDYQPGFDHATFPITVSARAPAFEQPRVGLVVVTAEPAVADAATAGVAEAVVAGIVITGPDATAAAATPDAAPMLASNGLQVSREEWSGLDSLMADPWQRLLDHGPATITWRYENRGNAVGETSTVFRIAELGPFGWLPPLHEAGTQVRSVESAAHVVLPGQVVTETLATDLAAASTQPAWSLPAWGVVRVTVRTTSVVAGLSAPAAEQSVVLVIAPWKEILALVAGFLALAASLLLVREGARKARGRGWPLHRTEVHVYTPVDGIGERTAPVRGFGRSALDEPAPDVAPDEPAPPSPAPAPPQASAQPRKRLQAPPPKSGTPTL